MPKISVIVPVYRVEQYLSRCIDSVIAQTFSDFELILVDDGSPDNCGAICDEYAKKDNRITVIHKDNGGVSSARNEGMKSACGEYLAFCDSDDYLESDFLQSLYYSAKTTDADIVSTGYRKSFSDGSEKIKEFSEQDVVFESEKQKFEYIICDFLLYKHGFEACMRLFRRKLIVENGIEFCTTCDNYSEDLGFVLKCILCAKHICGIKGHSYVYAIRKGSKMDLSESSLMLNPLNECSYDVYSFFKQCEYKDIFFPMIYFLIMKQGFSKVKSTKNYEKAINEFYGVEKSQWAYNNIKSLYKNKRVLRSFLDRRYTMYFRGFLKLLQNKNIKIFAIKRKIFYKTGRGNDAKNKCYNPYF